MITEDYCSQEVFQLLREKGFPVGVGSWSRGFVWDGEGYVPGLVKHENSITHQMAMKWLREVRGLFVDISFVKDEDRVFWFYAIFELYNDNEAHYNNVDEFPTYEGAVEAAIKFSLENLI